MPGNSRTERLVYILVSGGIVGGFLVLLLWNSVVIPINTGQVGVYFSRLFGGTIIDRIEPEGVALKFPWDTIHIVDVRTQTRKYTVPTLSSEGMRSELDVKVLFRPIRNSTPLLLKNIGPDYSDTVVSALSVEAIREVIGQLESMTIFTIGAKQLQADLLGRLRAEELAKYIEFQDLIISRVSLPVNISKAIEDKLTHEQMALSYSFRIDRQKLEAERLRIEAIGLQNFYSVVSEALTERLLIWRGIDATLKLAESPNAKVVIVGANGNLPLILGSDIHKTALPAKQLEAVPGHHSPLPKFDKLPPIFKSKRDSLPVPPMRDGKK
jgi:prohibitin 2